jgi:hypothetical protein
MKLPAEEPPRSPHAMMWESTKEDRTGALVLLDTVIRK